MTKSSPASIAARLQSLAEEAGMPRLGLAVRLSEICGVSPHAAHKWLKGITGLSRESTEKVAAAFGTTPAYILFGEVPGDIESSAKPMPLQIFSIMNLLNSGYLDGDDLAEIERFAKLLARKNKDIQSRR